MIIEQTGQNLPPLSDSIGDFTGEGEDNTEASFETVLDDACKRLEEKSREGYIKRLHKMEKTLDKLSVELEEIIRDSISSPLKKE